MSGLNPSIALQQVEQQQSVVVKLPITQERSMLTQLAAHSKTQEGAFACYTAPPKALLARHLDTKAYTQPPPHLQSRMTSSRFLLPSRQRCPWIILSFNTSRISAICSRQGRQAGQAGEASKGAAGQEGGE